MKIISVVLLILCFSGECGAQTAVRPDTSYCFLKNLKFTNGVDTVIVKGYLLDVVQAPPFIDYEERFLKKRRINKKRIGSVINFQPENCSKPFAASLMTYADKENFLDSNNLGISIIVTCVVYDGYTANPDHSPYVLVIKVAPKKPIGSL